jgi:hypothetical protein
MSNRTIYRILIGAAPEEGWMDWCDDVTVTGGHDQSTLLTTAPIDQVTLHGILDAIHDFDVPLLSVVQADGTGQASSESTVDTTDQAC